MGGGSSKVEGPRSVETKLFPEFEKTLPDLNERTIAITGCTTGTGLVAAKTLAKKDGVTVLMLNRSSERAEKAESSVKETASESSTVETIPCDLQNFESVKEAAATIREKHPAVDVLCNNAGVMALEDYATKDGYDVQMQTNHLSHFLLAKELMPCLEKAAELRGEARVVHHTSLARKGAPLEAKYLGKNGGNLGGNGSFMFTGAKWNRYHQSKLANAVFTSALGDRLKAADSKVIATIAAPGFASTNLQVTTENSGGGMGIMMQSMRMSQSAEDGTIPLLSAMFLPSSPGHLWEPSERGHMVGPPKEFELEKECVDKDSKEMLWEKSEEACGKFDI